MSSVFRKSALAAALCAAWPAAEAVTLSTDGLGQALIYPYYTAQSSRGDAFNTYISVVNHTPQQKALRVRFHEGRLGRETLSFNLYLGSNDVWTGAVVPNGDGTRLVTIDTSCTEPQFSGDLATRGAVRFVDFRTDAFASGVDGAGNGLDRTREGFVEILEMSTLTGATGAAITHNSAGFPANCAAVQGGSIFDAPPSGGLSGTLTLINVASGMDFTVNAEALDELASRSYFRRANDPYPDFDAAEIDAVSVVTADGVTFRSVWDNPVDAVSAVLMRDRAMAEYVLDEPTASLTDMVITLPTRHFHTNPTAAAQPFTSPLAWSASCSGSGEVVIATAFDREEAGAAVSADCGFPECPPTTPQPRACAASGVFSVRNNALRQMPPSIDTTAVLGSFTRGLMIGGIANVPANSRFSSGWLDLRWPEVNAMTSRLDSVRVDRNGNVATGAHTYRGLPMVGLAVRTFNNGALRCDAGTCQGNYGGSFPLKYRRVISP
jgi:hypothetical protein